jgi:hypothetical protein
VVRAFSIARSVVRKLRRTRKLEQGEGMVSFVAMNASIVRKEFIPIESPVIVKPVADVTFVNGRHVTSKRTLGTSGEPWFATFDFAVPGAAKENDSRAIISSRFLRAVRMELRISNRFAIRVIARKTIIYDQYSLHGFGHNNWMGDRD